jgi:hypothetical protein
MENSYVIRCADVPFQGNWKIYARHWRRAVLIISFATLVPFLGSIIAICVSGYFAAYSSRIINTTAIGEGQACDWPDFRDFWTDLFGP